MYRLRNLKGDGFKVGDAKKGSWAQNKFKTGQGAVKEDWKVVCDVSLCLQIKQKPKAAKKENKKKQKKKKVEEDEGPPDDEPEDDEPPVIVPRNLTFWPMCISGQRWEDDFKKVAFSLHYCGPRSLEKKEVHTRIDFNLSKVEGNMGGYWQGSGVLHNADGRWEGMVDRAEGPSKQWIQLHPSKPFPAVEPQLSQSEISRIRAAIELAKQWRAMYEAVMDRERHALIPRKVLEADILLGRSAADTFATALSELVKDMFGIVVAGKDLHTRVQWKKVEARRKFSGWCLSCRLIPRLGKQSNQQMLTRHLPL